MKSNRNIDSIIVSSDWHMDAKWGLQQLNQYLSELDAIESGADINYSERRERLKTSLLPVSADGYANDEELSNSEGYIAHHKLSGVMRLEDGMSSRGVNSIVSEMMAADRNSNVKGHILEINSGGGQATAGQALMNAVRDLQKPVYVYGHMIGSAALMGALPADKIYMSGNQSLIGSIGSLISIDKKMAEFYKENFDDIYSDFSTEKNIEWRSYLKGDKKPLINRVNQSAKAFMADVQQYRQLNSDLKESTVKGGMFTAVDGVERGLADTVGTFKQVLNDLSQNIENTQNNQTMNFNTFLSDVRSELNRIFNWSIADDADAKTVAGKLAEAATIQEQVASQVSDKLSVMTEQLTEMKAQLDSFKQSAEDAKSSLESLQTEVDQLKAEKESWNEEKTNMEQQIAELKGKKPVDGDEGTDVSGTLTKFNKQVGFLSVDGESKF